MDIKEEIALWFAIVVLAFTLLSILSTNIKLNESLEELRVSLSDYQRHVLNTSDMVILGHGFPETISKSVPRSCVLRSQDFRASGGDVWDVINVSCLENFSVTYMEVIP